MLLEHKYYYYHSLVKLGSSRSGGYEYEFVDAVDPKYICSICTMVIRDARLATCCGHHYCESCLRVWLNSSAQKLCPQCRQINFQNVINLEKIRDINQLRVRCTNKEKGCKWVGELGALKDHLESDNGCGYVMVTCSNTAYNVMQIRRSTLTTCGAAMERRHLTYHHKYQCLYRQYRCEYCGYVDTYDAIAGNGEIRNRDSMIMYGGNHYSQCYEYPLKCPNECGAENIKRKDMTTHLENCPLEPIKCPFSEVCNKYFRKDIQDHKRECDFRPYQCEHCGHNGTYLSMSGMGQFWTQPAGPNHYDQCEQYPLQCHNKCGAENIKRKDMKIHREKCPLELLDCPFKYAGCTSTEQRKDMDRHCRKSMQEHLLYISGSVTSKIDL